MQTELVQFIRETIRARGPVSFAWFMQQALYHPQHGYYSSGRCAIGRRGDYFTNVSVGPLFGRVLTAQFAEMWARLGEADNFALVEQGADRGDFALDVLESARQCYPDFFAALRYRIIEPFPILQDRQSQTLAGFEGKIEWRASIDALKPFVGVHFSNELLDSMPVHLAVSECEKALGAPMDCIWLEKFVALAGDKFVFVNQPTVDRKLREHLKELPAEPAGFQAEINLAALDWIDSLSSKLERGYVVMIDYGYPREELYAPQRSAGTLQVRAQHRLVDSPFEQIGHADITVHVNWTDIAKRAQKNGLRVAGFTDQHHFLTGIISEWPEVLPGKLSGVDSAASSRRVHIVDVDSKTKRELQTLLHPEMLGRSFQVLALGKDVDSLLATGLRPGGAGTRLAGFKFARNAGP